MAFNIVLITPEIPNNTGNIGRLSLASGCHLHLVKPFGFELNDTRVKRAGLDYWKHVPLTIYENTEEFFGKHQDKKMAFLSSHGHQSYWDIPFEKDMFFIFGKESEGLAAEILKNNEGNTYKIPIHSEHIRSINLANAVSVVVYEALRNFK
jgi:tRNA (cytidine/uridine-2'-O-)-methyltransferase